jgi:solute:Na+ symporter, SSS family
MLPDFGWDVAVPVFVVPLAVQWWSTWYPGAEPGGGSYIAQRMLAARTERDALPARSSSTWRTTPCAPGPGSGRALVDARVSRRWATSACRAAHVDPRLLGHDMAYPAMLTFVPPGLLGLVVAGLLMAYVSTISTHLNWGTSYLVHDFYRRFVRPAGPSDTT